MTICHAWSFLFLLVVTQDVAAFEKFLGAVQQKIRAAIAPSKKQKPNEAVLPMLEAASRSQSITNRIEVERLIDELTELSSRNKDALRKPIQAGSYRTAWSTVTADNFVGFLLNNPPSNILGGPSWQIFSNDRKHATNIVYWKGIDIRMAGLARLSPLKGGGDASDGYDLQISGLEFRWGAGGCPEKYGSFSDTGKSWTLLELPEDETLGNGVGTLGILYNDGVVRITRDDVQDNTYVHIREPLDDDLEKMFAHQML